MRRKMVLALCVVLSLSFAACQDLKGQTKDDEKSSTQMANPFTDCGTLADAVQLAGFEMTAPETAGGYSRQQVQAIKGELIQIAYGEKAEEQVLIRKAAGDGDISGDYRQYETSETVTEGELAVTVKSNGEKAYLAFWAVDGYAYSVQADGGMEKQELMEIVQSVE